LDTGDLTATSLSVEPGTLKPASYSWTVTATGSGGTSAPLATAFTFTVLSPQPSAQTVEMRGKYAGWDPATLHIKAGARVTWIIWGDEVTSCTNRIIVPSLSISLPLKAGKNSVTFTAPSKAGVVPFSCWMGMVRGQFVVDP
ncbi:MAG: cupredoxin domain-containing protein, partial [Caldisericota bacterium]|nr:cupredoxin domain-containing protein [Caldisericota bacterium]